MSSSQKSIVVNNRDKFEANKRRMNMYLPVAIADALDREAESIGCNRTEMLIHILLNYFEQKKAMSFAEIASKVNIPHQD